MAETIKGQASPNAHFFHVTPSRTDGKWRVKEVRAQGAIACDTKEEALQRVRELKNEVENGHVVVHDEHGRFQIIESFLWVVVESLVIGLIAWTFGTAVQEILRSRTALIMIRILALLSLVLACFKYFPKWFG